MKNLKPLDIAIYAVIAVQAVVLIYFIYGPISHQIIRQIQILTQ